MFQLESVDQSAAQSDGHGAVAKIEGNPEFIALKLFLVEGGSARRVATGSAAVR
jgi:hypothetical protein